jgi:hypothetical protein
MPQFKARSDYDPPVVASDTPRQKLAQAIIEKAQAERALADTEAAEQAAFERQMDSERRLSQLREAHAREPDGGATAFIAATAAGVDVGVAELQAPAHARAAEVATVEREIEALGSVRKEIEARIEPARQAVVAAQDRVRTHARAVMAGAINVDELLGEARTAADFLLGQRALFIYLMTILPPGPEHEQIAYFMSRPWLQNELNDWRKAGSITPYAQAYEALQHDAEAAVDLSAP